MPKINIPTFKPFTVHLSWLRRQNACMAQQYLFEERFGKKLRVTEDMIPGLASEFDIRWFIDRAFMRDPLLTYRLRYLDLCRNACDRSYVKFKKAAKAKKMLDRYGFVLHLSAKRQLEYNEIYDKRAKETTRYRTVYYTRCLSHLGGRVYK